MNIERQIIVLNSTKDKKTLWDLAVELKLDVAERNFNDTTVAVLKEAILEAFEKVRENAGGSKSEDQSSSQEPDESEQRENFDAYTSAQWLDAWITRARGEFCEGLNITTDELSTMVRKTYNEKTLEFQIKRMTRETVGDNLNQMREIEEDEFEEIMANLTMNMHDIVSAWFKRFSEYTISDIRNAKMLKENSPPTSKAGNVDDEASSIQEIPESPATPPAKKRKADTGRKFILPTPSAAGKAKHKDLFDDSDDETMYQVRRRPISNSPSTQTLELKKKSQMLKLAELDSRIMKLNVTKLNIDRARRYGFNRWYLDFLNECKTHNFSDQRTFVHLVHPDYLEPNVLGEWYSQMPPRDRNLEKLLIKLDTIYPGVGSTHDDIRKFQEYRMTERQSFAEYDARKKSLYEKAYPRTLEEMFKEDGVTHDVTNESVFLNNWKQGLYKDYIKVIAAKEPSFQEEHNREMTYQEIAKIVRAKEAAKNNIARYGIESPENKDKKEKRGKKRTRKSRSPEPQKAVCRNFLRGSCSRGNNCSFSHVDPKAKVTAPTTKINNAQRTCGFTHTNPSVAPHPYHACTDPKIVCKGCNKKGHLKYWCPDETCQTCKKKGHSTEAHSWSKTDKPLF